MNLGNRRIRSAGRTSGSVEITLPALLQVLEGINCHLLVREGLRPEIVLQPDLSAAQDLFQMLWHKLQLGLAEIGELPDFAMADFSLTLFPLQHWQERPPLSYADALVVLQSQKNASAAGASASGNGKNDSKGQEDALARLVAFLTVTAAYHLGLKGKFALAFGDAVAYVMTGNPTNLGTDFERGMAHRLFWGDAFLQAPSVRPFSDLVWQQSRPALRRMFDQFVTWQESPATCAIARDQWYRALTVELKTF